MSQRARHRLILVLALVGLVSLCICGSRYFPTQIRDLANGPFFPLLVHLPWALWCLVGVLGWWLNRTSTILWVAFFIALYCVQQGLVTSTFGANETLLAIPWVISVLFLSRERRLPDWRFWIPLVFTGAVFGAAKLYLRYGLSYELGCGVGFGVLLLMCLVQRKRSSVWMASLIALLICHGIYMEDTSQGVVWLTHLAAAGIPLVFLSWTYWQKVYLDELTEIPNRRALDEHLALARGGLAIAMVDVDHFKKFNDRYGHQAGDQVLRMVARHLDRHATGRVFRFGGEEFSVVYEGNGRDEIIWNAQDLVMTLANKKFVVRRGTRGSTSARDRGRLPTRSDKRVHVTVSIGVALQRPAEPTASVVERADKALYRAKKKGRNCVVLGG